jgi:hypothetical protein
MLQDPAGVPCRVQAESGSQLLENDVKNAPNDCVAGLPGEGIDLSITKAEWRADKSELKVEGRGSAGSEVVIRNADSTEELGFTTTDANGIWKFILQDPAGVPCRVQAESGSQLLENDVKNAPNDCVAGLPGEEPPVEGIDLSITKAEWKADKSELKVEGRGSVRSEVAILDADSIVLGFATTDEEGKWKFKLENQNPDEVPCRVQAGYESGNQFLENKVKNAPDNCV